MLVVVAPIGSITGAVGENTREIKPEPVDPVDRVPKGQRVSGEPFCVSGPATEVYIIARSGIFGDEATVGCRMIHLRQRQAKKIEALRGKPSAFHPWFSLSGMIVDDVEEDGDASVVE